jgi:DNA ligase 1
MELATIFKLDVVGNVRVWRAEIGEDENEGCWRTHSGRLNGKIIISEWKRVAPRSQDTSLNQAIFYASAEMKKKLKTDYRISIDDVNESRGSLIRPMLAGPYVGWQGPCFAQPKLDGMRCIANKDGLWSRLDSRIISVPHIEGSLKTFFKEYPEIVLDGELYNHELKDNFNMIMSIARKTKLEFEDFKKSEMYIQYWIFDMFDLEQSPTFRQRWNFLKEQLFNKLYDHPFMIIETPTRFITTQEELDIYNYELLKDGYEGQIVRFDTPYEEKRTSNLLKRKEFQDQEFELLDIEEGQGNWEGMAKIAICRATNGEEFGAGIAGTQEDNVELLRNKDKYFSVTVKYQALTPDGIPRFPIAIKFYEEMFGGLEERIKPRKDLFS